MSSRPATALRGKLEFLRNRAAYPDLPEFVELIETHFAWVFLSRRFVYKLKKPICFRGLDLTTAAMRRANCELEVSLNRRLAATVYVAVVPLSHTGSGWALESDAAPVDWLVKMHRLPHDRMLDQIAAQGMVSDSDLRRLVETLAAFYLRAPRAPWSGAEYRLHLDRTVEQQAEQLAAPGLGLDEPRIRTLAEAQSAFIREHGELLDARIAAGRVVDAHGDLRPEHVYLGPDVQIIDCLEFSAELRLLDSAEEISFLALECDRLGHSATGERIVELYCQTCADEASRELLGFYRSIRAAVRALLAILRVPDAASPEAALRWRQRANTYLDAAAAAMGVADSASPR